MDNSAGRGISVGSTVTLNSGGGLKTVSRIMARSDDRGELVQLVWDGYGNGPGVMEVPMACVRVHRPAPPFGSGVPGDDVEDGA